MNGVKKAVITTAGMGTRFLPATKAVPKSMLPIVDRPILDYIIDEAAASGMEEAIVVIGSNAEVIEKHFERDAYLEERLKSDKKDELLAAVRKITDRIKITFVTQEEMNGLAGALLYAEKAVGNEPFALHRAELRLAHARGHGAAIVLKEPALAEAAQHGVRGRLFPAERGRAQTHQLAGGDGRVRPDELRKAQLHGAQGVFVHVRTSVDKNWFNNIKPTSGV